jgi:hypothetical protein
LHAVELIGEALRQRGEPAIHAVKCGRVSQPTPRASTDSQLGVKHPSRSCVRYSRMVVSFATGRRACVRPLT